MAIAKQKIFFDHPHKLAVMFTQPHVLRYEQQKWFDKRGLKAIEAFESDISRNLIAWSTGDKSIFYMTKRWWYEYSINKELWLDVTRYENSTWRRWDTWMNQHSTSVGKKWLTQEPQKSKWIPLFREG